MAEGRAIADMKATGKPFRVILNTRDPGSAQAEAVRKQIQDRYGVEPLVTDCQTMDLDGIKVLIRGTFLEGLTLAIRN